MKLLSGKVAAPLATPGAPGASLGQRAADGDQRGQAGRAGHGGEPGLAGPAGRAHPAAVPAGPGPRAGQCGTHAVVAAQIGTLSAGGGTGRRDVGSDETGHAGDRRRGFFSFEFWRDRLLTGADLLFRVPAGLKLPVLRTLPDGSYLSEVASRKARSSGFKVPLETAGDPRNATHIPVRVIEYTVSPARPGGTAKTFRLITTIMDPDDVTAVELAAAYAERWNTRYRCGKSRPRCPNPAGGSGRNPRIAAAGLWGLLLADFAIRSLMAEAAASAGLDPDRLSFMRSISLIRRQVTDQAAVPRKTRTSHGNSDRGDPGTSQ